MKKIIGILISLVLFVQVYAQQTGVWTLEKCIDYALNNNVQVKQQQLQVKNAQATVLQDKLGLAPSLNGYAGHGYNWGKTVDRYTNQFATQRVQTNNFYLSSQVTLFEGFQKINKLKQSQADLVAANYDNDRFMNDLSLSIATAYLQILYYKEMYKIADNQLNATDLQVQRLTKMVNAGALAQGDLYNIQAQRASENSQMVDAKNNLDIAYLTLAQLLDLPTTNGFEIESPDLDLGNQPSILLNPDKVYEFALANQPAVKSSEMKLKSSEYMLNQAKGTSYPSLSMQGSIGTGYSGAAMVLDKATVNGTQTIGYVVSNGQMLDVLSPKYDITYKNKLFNDQLKDNINKSISFNLSLPIFNGFSSRSAISKAKLNMESSKYNLETTKLQLRKTIQQAYADAKAALNRYQSSLTSLDASRESFRYAEQKFGVGAMNAVDYNNAKTAFEKAESNLLQAKYEYIFKTTVLDFYMGNPISLKRK